jgi:hypothetical protein
VTDGSPFANDGMTVKGFAAVCLMIGFAAGVDMSDDYWNQVG